jgi:hypothetical protein
VAEQRPAGPLGRARREFAQHLPAAITVGVSLALGLAVGVGSFLLQTQFASSYDAGHRLSGWQNFLRLGAPWQALVPVLLAGLLATIGAARLSRTEPEPPLHLGRQEASSAGQLRAAMRIERRVVRIAFLAMSGLAGMVLVRVVVYSVLALAGNALARSTLVGVAVELGVWALAWVAVWNWNRVYRARMEGWGVLSD